MSHVLQVRACVCVLSAAAEHLNASGSFENTINDSCAEMNFNAVEPSEAASMLTNDPLSALSIIIIITWSRFLFRNNELCCSGSGWIVLY